MLASVDTHISNLLSMHTWTSMIWLWCLFHRLLCYEWLRYIEKLGEAIHAFCTLTLVEIGPLLSSVYWSILWFEILNVQHCVSDLWKYKCPTTRRWWTCSKTSSLDYKTNSFPKEHFILNSFDAFLSSHWKLAGTWTRLCRWTRKFPHQQLLRDKLKFSCS